MCTTRHFAIALVSVMIREEISIASMILRRDELGLDTDEDGEIIAWYICGNLRYYGYRVGKCYSRRKGEFYQLEKI